VFVSQLGAERGARPADVVRAYRIAREVVRAEADWEAIEALEGEIEADVQAELMGRVDMLVDAVTRWYLVEGVSGDLASAIESGCRGFVELVTAAPELGGEELQAARRATAERLVAAGVPEGLATAHALRPGLVHTPAVAAVASATGRSVADVARVFVAIGERLPLNELEEVLGSLPATRRMERWALQAAREDGRRARWDIAEHALAAAPGAEPIEALDRFLADHAEDCRRLGAFMRTLSREGTTDLAGLALAVRQLRELAE
jgi:glutamate dehydrogenase